MIRTELNALVQKGAMQPFLMELLLSYKHVHQLGLHLRYSAVCSMVMHTMALPLSLGGRDSDSQ